jgi:thiosulfate/3-mercaptopyruvate sulfurtransferase
MSYTTLISTDELSIHLGDPNWAVIDCRFLLTEPDRGEKNYLDEHIPGAVYAHLDRDLSGEIIPGKTSRHPLPDIEHCSKIFSKMGIDANVQVVAYDDMGGALAAVRLWWMLRWLGHPAVAVLDGGWIQWHQDGYPTASGAEYRSPRTFVPQPNPDMLVDAAQIAQMVIDPDQLVIDVREPERYRGEFEPIDTVAGHIPGAINAPFKANLGSDGRFKTKAELLEMYQPVLGEIPADHIAVYCGSGVTSIHSILAMLYAGLGEARLYAGSWSEWITDPSRPIATS